MTGLLDPERALAPIFGTFQSRLQLRVGFEAERHHTWKGVRNHCSKSLMDLGNPVQLESGNLGSNKRRRVKSEAGYSAMIIKSSGGSTC